MKAWNLITFGDISKCTYYEIRNVCKNYSRVSTKKGKGIRGTIVQTLMYTTRLTKVEIENLMKDMKINILHL